LSHVRFGLNGLLLKTKLVASFTSVFRMWGLSLESPVDGVGTGLGVIGTGIFRFQMLLIERNCAIALNKVYTWIIMDVSAILGSNTGVMTG
jgi:hypothetical protein